MMQTTRYPLTALKNHLERSLEETQRALADARRELSEARARAECEDRLLEPMQEAYVRARDQALDEQFRSLFDVGEANRFHEALLAFAERVAVQRQKGADAHRRLDRCVEDEEKALGELSRAQQAFGNVERHEQRWVAEKRRAASRREARELAEISSALWLRRRRESMDTETTAWAS